MNKIVIEHYPVERLPDDLRAAAGGLASVRLTVEADRPLPSTPEQMLAQLRAEKVGKRVEDGVTLEEAVARIRTLRDEWED